MASNSAVSVLDPLTSGPISLAIPPMIYCPGCDVEGEVLLEFPKVLEEPHIDEVLVVLRGKLEAYVLDQVLIVSHARPCADLEIVSGTLVAHGTSRSVVISQGTISSTVSEKGELVSIRTSLWTRGSAYPPPGSNVLRLPFSFHLPSDQKLLPSVPRDSGGHSASIQYHVEMLAHRSTILFGYEYKTMRRQLTVVSRGDPGLCASIRALQGSSVEGGPTWKTVHREKKMRRGIWGEYSTARVELLIPNQHGILPTCIDIPLLITVKTTTPRLSRAKADKHLEGKPIFPAINFNTNDPRFIILRQSFTIRVGSDMVQHHTNEIVLAYIKPRDIPSSAYYKHWQAETTASDREEMGRWVQQWTIQRNISLQRFPQTFESAFVDCVYTMSIQVPFPGLGNDIEVSMPITLDSGIDKAMPKNTGRTARRLGSQTFSSLASAPSASGLGTSGVPVTRVEDSQSLVSRPP